MTWVMIERLALAVAALLLLACAVVGFRWVASPYLWGYAATAGVFLVLSLLAATFA
jgi:hypothetical protein